MVALAEETGQMDLFPRVIECDIVEAKRKLSQYRRCKEITVEFERRGIETLTPKQRMEYDHLVTTIRNLESAVRLILDREVREIVQYRYIDGNAHKLTIIKFTASMDDSTVDRKLRKGIESIAESLKFF